MALWRSRAALAKGAEIHARLQRRFEKEFPGFEKEIFFKHQFDGARFVCVVQGRADCLFPGDPPIIEEIKSTSMPESLAASIEADPEHPYRLQALMYAYLYFLEHGAAPQTRLRLVSSYDQTETLLLLAFEPEVLADWVAHRLAALESLALDQIEEARRRRAVAEHLTFPFLLPRPGQEKLMDLVSAGMKQGCQLLVQAPTGLGKTVAILLPMLSHALQAGRKLFYVTPKNSQHAAVVATADLLAEREGHPVRVLVLTAKEKICMQEEPICDPRYCRFAKGYFDKMEQYGVCDRVAQKSRWDFELFVAMAESFEVCPFELSLEMSSRADLIVGDYNYVFSPNAALGHFFDECEPGSYDLIVDEAHNLYERAMGYYSPRLFQSGLRGIGEGLEGIPAAFARKARAWLDKAESLLDEVAAPVRGSSGAVSPDPKPFFRLENHIGLLLGRYLQKVDVLGVKDPLLALYRYWSEFCGVWRLGDPSFFFSVSRNDNGCGLLLTCRDASRFLRQRLTCFRTVVAFSATLKPAPFYRQLSGFDEDKCSFTEFASPFPQANRKVMIIPQVATTFKERSRHFARIGEIINRVLCLRKGNYFVFFPSYKFLSEVAPFLQLPGFRLFRQESGMSRRDIEKLLRKLEQKRKNVVILAVQGGVFSEGVDYPGDRLIGAVVVGPGLPAYTFERQAIRDYYQQAYGAGFDYAYTYPGMARTVQAAGRVIRSETDRGLILLLGRRFLDQGYTQTMPAEWFSASVDELVSRRILEEIRQFWQLGTGRPKRPKSAALGEKKGDEVDA